MAASTVLATQPANGRPRARTASAVSSAWLMQPRRRPTTSTTGSPRSTARSAVSQPGTSGTRNPPTPSTNAMSARAATPRTAASSESREMVRPSRRAAMCGAQGVRSCSGPTSSSRRSMLLAARRRSTSSLTQRPSTQSCPAASGLMAAARRPDCAARCVSAAVMAVLPISVSVPVMKNAPHAPPLRGSLPPRGGCFSSWGGPALKNAPHAPPLRGSLPPRGGCFSSWGGPATKKPRVMPAPLRLRPAPPAGDQCQPRCACHTG